MAPPRQRTRNQKAINDGDDSSVTARGVTTNRKILEPQGPPQDELSFSTPSAAETTTTATTTTPGSSSTSRPLASTRGANNETDPRVGTRGLLNFADLPKWQQDNGYILTSYRPASYSFRRSFASVLALHNETVNINTHLFGGLLFACLPAYVYLRPGAGHGDADADSAADALRQFAQKSPWTSADTVAFGCFFAGAIVCLLTSATYHTISNHSASVAALGNKLDYVGIVALITGSFVPSVYYSFYCEPHFQLTYWTMICGLGAICAVVSVSPKFRTPEWRPFRAAMFVGMGLSAVFPVLHGLSRWGWSAMEERIGLSWLILQGMLYIAGAGLYAARVPEKWSPGTFDIWGSSHQIFHVFVVMAACSHLMGLLIASNHARSTTCS